MSEPSPHRRRYDGTLRRQRAAETRERIMAAGAELLHASSIRDWGALTIRAVAERAGVNERTVYRHFGNERGLRDALMQHLEQEAGIDLATLELDEIADVTARVLRYVSSYPIEARPPLDPTLVDASLRQHEALVKAVTGPAADWPEADRRVAAAIFDLLWSVSSYERLVADWRLDPDQAAAGLTWVIRLVEEAVRDGRRPS